jgi:subtilisin family serine protease
VAGLIGAKGNNGIGMAGLNWNIQIIPGKISNDPKGAAQSSTMVKCIQWAIDHNIRVVNLSYSGTESDAIRDASKTLFENNGLLIYTIGNAGVEVTRPYNPYALTVGASDDYDFKPPWSNTGEALDLVAPGVWIYSTDGNGAYKNVQGTSFAAPLVTGTVALLISLNPERPMKELRQIIIDSAKDLWTPGKDKAFGFGRLDISKAMEIHRSSAAVANTTVRDN